MAIEGHTGRIRRERAGRGLTVLIGAAALIFSVALAGALQSVDRPFPSLFVDPFGDYSVVFREHWRTVELGVALHENVRPLAFSESSEGGAERLDSAAKAAAARARTQLDLVVVGSGGSRVVRAPLRRIDPTDVWWFFGLYATAALFLLWSAVSVFMLARRRPAARAYLALGSVGFAFLVTFFDYHTTRWLSPLFAGSTLGNAVAIGAVAWCFPQPLRGRRRRLWARAALVVGIVLSALLAVDTVVKVNLRPLRVFTSLAVPAALLALAIVVFLRLRSARGQARRELAVAGWGLAGTASACGSGFFVMWAANVSAFHMLLPLVALAIPASVGYAIVRHNVLELETVLRRRTLGVPLLLVGTAVGGSTWAWLRGPGSGPEHAAEPAIVGALVGAGVAFAGWQWLTRVLFPARSRFQPTIEELADRLSAEREPDLVRARMAELVKSFLPTDRVEVLTPDALATIDAFPADGLPALREGRHAWTDEDPRSRHLVVPMRSAGELLGAVVGPKDGRALVTADDVRLVQTIASLGALTIHNVSVLRQLDEHRRIEVVATRGDKRLVLDVLMAEIAHELAYPLGFLRHFLRQVGQGRATEDLLAVGQDEVARLERMLAWVRRLQIPRPEMRRLPLHESIERALVLLRPEIDERKLRCEIEVPADLTVMADPDPLLQLLLNLMRNAMQAIPDGGSFGVRTVDSPPDTILEVWDAGPGIPEDAAGKIFAPWFTTRREGTGLGLAVVQRVARSFRWEVDVGRRHERTVFTIRIPTPKEAP